MPFPLTIPSTLDLPRGIFCAGLAIATAAALPAHTLAQAPAPQRSAQSKVVKPPTTVPVTDPPKSWIDKDTGHRIFRLTDEPGSSAPCFNINAYTPDGKEMIYSAPDGIHVFVLAARTTRLVVPSPPRDPHATGPGAGFRGGVRASWWATRPTRSSSQNSIQRAKPAAFTPPISTPAT